MPDRLENIASQNWKQVCVWCVPELEWGPPSVWEEGSVCNRFPTPVCILSYILVQCYLQLWQLHSDFGDFSNEVCHVTKITTAESNPYMGLLTQQTFCFLPDVFSTENNLPIMTMSLHSGRDLKQVFILKFKGKLISMKIIKAAACARSF